MVRFEERRGIDVRPIDLKAPAPTIDHKVVLRDLNLGIRPARLVKRHIEDQRNERLKIVD